MGNKGIQVLKMTLDKKSSLFLQHTHFYDLFLQDFCTARNYNFFQILFIVILLDVTLMLCCRRRVLLFFNYYLIQFQQLQGVPRNMTVGE